MTELTTFQRQIAGFLPEMKLKFHEPLSRHTSFRIGGRAEVMAFPDSPEELSQLLKIARELGVTPRILGAGTNVLAPDEGVQGLVICLKNALKGKELLPTVGMIRVYAGESLASVAVFAANNALTGLEFAHGIPGTVGGGVYMNAGAYGGELGQICTQAAVMDMDGNLRLLSRQELAFSYRNSALQQTGDIVVWADLQLEKGNRQLIRQTMAQLKEKRGASQPLDLPSAGSAFKRPAVGYAAAMIDQAGLKGFQIGGAAVSQKHAGFVVNLGGATAADVKALLAAVADKVEEQNGIRLQPEIRIW